MKFGKLTATAWILVLMQPSIGIAQDVPQPPTGASEQILLGAKLYLQNCALCHGAKGGGATVFPRPIWGAGHDIGKFNTAKGLFEYIQMLMPFDDPAKVDDAGKTAIVGYMLMRNGNLKAAETLPLGGNQVAIK
jgi:mono/diheme cytochrome c family protein